MELNAMLRRALASGFERLRAPLADAEEGRTLSSVHIRHVVAMVRHILENLSEPLTNEDIAAVTWLHRNYAMALFSRTMRLPMKRFVIRMRLIRARALLMESSAAIATVADQSGFVSMSQFYQHFRAACGLSPRAMRMQYARMELR
jgi:transcriptional regulator GlxA family with amidase domain